jgi:glyoxylase-like metal-dependent hydrolase (beta-lactamase superfamily II)
MLFHSGLRRLFPLVSEAIRTVMPVERLRYVGLSHFEADECGALNELLAAAPNAVPVCGQVAALVSVNDYADRAPRALADGELLALGKHTMKWFDTPHVPHAWECGLMLDTTTRTFFCGDLTQGGAGDDALTEADILGPSEAFRADGLLRAYVDARAARAPGARGADDARVHARQRVRVATARSYCASSRPCSSGRSGARRASASAQTPGPACGKGTITFTAAPRAD